MTGRARGCSLAPFAAASPCSPHVSPASNVIRHGLNPAAGSMEAPYAIEATEGTAPWIALAVPPPSQGMCKPDIIMWWSTGQQTATQCMIPVEQTTATPRRYSGGDASDRSFDTLFLTHNSARGLFRRKPRTARVCACAHRPGKVQRIQDLDGLASIPHRSMKGPVRQQKASQAI